MSKKMNKKILHITYIAKNGFWFHKVGQAMDYAQRQKYKYPLPELGRSISRKLSLIQVLIFELNLELKEINKVLKKNRDKVNECISRNIGYSFGKSYSIYKILAYIEAILFETKSTTDLIIRYISKFYANIFSKRKGEKLILKELKRNKINLDWKYELDHIRRVYIHHFSGWASFEDYNNSFRLMIDLPKSIRRFKGFKKFPYETLNIDKINEILAKFGKFNDNAFNFLISKIYKL